MSLDRRNLVAVSVVTLAGLLIWALHFLIVYATTALACARGFADASLFGIGVVQLTVLVATVAGLVAVGAITLAGFRWARRTDDAGASFVRWLTGSIALLSFLAIAWDGLPALLVPACPGLS
jgi:hypothetical protein